MAHTNPAKALYGVRIGHTYDRCNKGVKTGDLVRAYEVEPPVYKAQAEPLWESANHIMTPEQWKIVHERTLAYLRGERWKPRGLRGMLGRGMQLPVVGRRGPAVFWKHQHGSVDMKAANHRQR